MHEVMLLVRKDVLLEWRMRYAIGGIVLYVLTTVFVIYTILNSERAFNLLNYKWWSILFWITMIFTAVNAIAKSFVQENRERQLYYYTLVSPYAVVLAKMMYNTLLMLVLSLIGLVLFGLMITLPVKDYPVFMMALLLGGGGFSCVLTLVSAIASRADNNATLMAILSLPVLLPLVMLIQKLAGQAFFSGNDWSTLWRDVLVLVAFDAMVVALSYILFPYLWRD